MCVATSQREKKAAKITFAQIKRRTLQSIIYPPEEKIHWNERHIIWYEVIVVCCLPTLFFRALWSDKPCAKYVRNLRKIPTHIHFNSLTTGSPRSKYQHRRTSSLLRNIRNIRICMGKKPIISVTFVNERISIKNSLPYLNVCYVPPV